MRVAVAGTFNVLHKGHKAMIDLAFERGDTVLIGITSDAFARSTREMVNPLHKRVKAVFEHLEEREYSARWDIQIISDRNGGLECATDVDALIVSPMSYDAGQAINELREKNGLKPLTLLVSKPCIAEDGGRISSSRVMSGEIDSEGRK